MDAADCLELKCIDNGGSVLQILLGLISYAPEPMDPFTHLLKIYSWVPGRCI